MRIRLKALFLSLFLVLGVISPVQAADVRIIDVAQITWIGADAPTSSMSDVVSAIQNQVGPNWASFTTLQGDTRDRTISFTYGQTLTTPIRLTSRMACDRSDFTSFMNTLRSEVYRQLGLSDWKERYLVILTPAAGCIWSGRAGIGSASSKGGVMVLHNTASAFVITHELGHTLGLGHSNLLRCSSGATDGAWSQNCKAVEYGGSIDVMGNVETSSPLSTYHQWRMGLLDASEVKQSWLSESIELTASDIFGGTRAVFIRDGKSTYWIEYRRPREGAPYNAGLVIYRTDPPSPIFIDSPNPEDRANSEPGLAVGTDIWMLNLDSYIYSATGRATGSMSLTTNKTTTLYSGNISLEVIPSSTTQKITLKVNRKADISPPPLPKLTEASTWVFENSELLQPGFEDVDSEIEFFEMSIDGKISRLKDSRAYNYAPTYLDPFQNRKTLYTRELPEGIYSLSIRTVDVWGNRSQWTTPQKVSIDRGIPIVTEEIKVSGVSRENLSIEFNGTKDIGSKICISQIINEDGFVLKTSQREVSPEFQFKKDSEIVGQMQVFDCLGNGSSNDFYLKNNYYAASKSARTGKWVSSNVADGAVTCIGKCSASISAAGRIRILMGSGKASAMLGNKSIATFDDSIANQIRTSVPVDIGKQKRVIRVSGSNFTFVGIASINLSVSGQLKKLRQSPPADRSLEDPIQGRLSKFGFSPEDFDQEWNVTPLYRGTTLEDPTLDLCSAIYKSEENREHRRQLTVLRSNSPYIFLSSEVVKYKDKSAADAALAELKANYEACVKNKGGVERDGTFVDYSFSSLPASNAVLAPEGSRVVVRAQIGKGVTARQLLAFYQFKGEMFTGLYIVKGGEVALSEAEVKRWFDAASIMAQRLDVKF